MKFIAAIAAIALIGVEAKKYSSYSLKKVNATKVKLERAFGPGLVELYNEHGKFEHHKLQWAYRHKGQGRHKLAGQISQTIIPGFTIDATGSDAWWMGFSNGFTYTGLENEETSPLVPNESVDLTNCFASTFAILEDFDTLKYNIATFNSEPGTAKWFDLAALDPAHILLDYSVEWEMCDFSNIYGQFKAMAGADWAAVADNLTREVTTMIITTPGIMDQIKAIRAAAECAIDAVQDSGLVDDLDIDIDLSFDDGTLADDLVDTVQDVIEENEEVQFTEFITDEEIEAAKAAAEAVKGCAAGIDKWAIGNLAGELFAKFFNSELKPNVG